MSHPRRLQAMTQAQAEAELRTRGQLILPSGTLENRGSHLPLGTDTIILDRLADAISARTGVPRAPIIPYGVRGWGPRAVPGAARLSRKALHRVMNELIAAWEEDAGVRDVFVLTAHAAEAHQEALSAIRALGRVRVVDIFSLDFSTILETSGPLHGGELDTSLLLFLEPELVGPPPPELRASAEKGRRLYNFILDRLVGTWFPGPHPAPVPETGTAEVI